MAGGVLDRCTGDQAWERALLHRQGNPREAEPVAVAFSLVVNEGRFLPAHSFDRLRGKSVPDRAPADKPDSMLRCTPWLARD
jgi:hypothetical protein